MQSKCYLFSLEALFFSSSCTHSFMVGFWNLPEIENDSWRSRCVVVMECRRVATIRPCFPEFVNEQHQNHAFQEASVRDQTIPHWSCVYIMPAQFWDEHGMKWIRHGNRLHLKTAQHKRLNTVQIDADLLLKFEISLLSHRKICLFFATNFVARCGKTGRHRGGMSRATMSRAT